MSGDPAKARFFIVQAARWSGMLLVGIGLLGVYRRLALPAALAEALVAVGLAVALIVPSVLTRRWRSPRE